MKNYVASVQARLRNIARAEEKNLQLLIIRYFQERILFRIAKSEFRDHFYLKGGALLYALEREKSRPTMDLDLLGTGLSPTSIDFRSIFTKILSIAYGVDGVTFDTSNLTLSEITKAATYGGLRIKVPTHLGNIRQPMQIDIGFGDVVTPGPVAMKYPTLLDMAAPEILSYSTETVIAEKFEAMITLAEMNSRMKDFYDVYRLLTPGKYNERILADAIRNTLRTRATSLSTEHVLFDPAFALDESRNKQWLAFLRKAKLPVVSFQEVHERIAPKLQPIYERIK
ncbi:MAG: nucleotidyl transferase AbiEii/AbiGii toxin family protein [Bacteroidota bacterium]